MIFEKIQLALASQFEIDANSISLQTDIIADLGADSLDLVELIMALEDEFGFSVTDESVYSCKTVAEIVAFVETLTASS